VHGGLEAEEPVSAALAGITTRLHEPSLVDSEFTSEARLTMLAKALRRAGLPE
jgi:hypothetical protein